MKAKYNTNEFKAISWEKRYKNFESRTATPGVGYYNPRKESLMEKSYDAHINTEHSAEREAVNLKL